MPPSSSQSKVCLSFNLFSDIHWTHTNLNWRRGAQKTKDEEQGTTKRGMCKCDHWSRNLPPSRSYLIPFLKPSTPFPLFQPFPPLYLISFHFLFFLSLLFPFLLAPPPESVLTSTTTSLCSLQQGTRKTTSPDKTNTVIHGFLPHPEKLWIIHHTQHNVNGNATQSHSQFMYVLRIHICTTQPSMLVNM